MTHSRREASRWLVMVSAMISFALTAGVTLPLTGPFLAGSVFAQTETTSNLVYSSFLGGSSWDTTFALAFDEQGFLYLAGETASSDFPLTSGAVNQAGGQGDLFVVKYYPPENRLIFAALIGGSQPDSVYDLRLANGVIYLVGETYSPDFPLAGALKGEKDAFLLAMSGDGSRLLFSTLLGGSDQESANALTIANEAIFVTGITYSNDFPASNNRGEGDAFLAHFNLQGELQSATLLGGRQLDVGYAVQAKGEQIILAGQTYSRDFPASGLSGLADGFVASFNQEDGWEWVTLLGGFREDKATSLSLSAQGQIYLGGETASGNLPQAIGSLRGDTDLFISTVTESGEVLASLYTGGSGIERNAKIYWDNANQVFLTGSTNSTDLAGVNDSFQNELAGQNDAFLARVEISDPTRLRLLAATYLGGSADDHGLALALDNQGNAWIAGQTQSSDFPSLPNALFNAPGSSQEAFFAALRMSAVQSVLPTLPPPIVTLAPSLTPTQPQPEETVNQGLTSDATPPSSTLSPPPSSPMEESGITPEPVFTQEVLLSATDNQAADLAPTQSSPDQPAGTREMSPVSPIAPQASPTLTLEGTGWPPVTSSGLWLAIIAVLIVLGAGLGWWLRRRR